MSFTFKIQNYVDDMLEKSRSGDGSIFCYMSNQKQCDVALFTDSNQCASDFTDLGYATGCTFDRT